MSRSARIVWLDIAKGICMLAVIAGHLGQTDVNKIVFAFHLTLFFILSGFTLKPEISTESASKRFLRLMRPYLITCTAILVMDVINLIVINKVTDTLTITQKMFSDIVRSFFRLGRVHAHRRS